MKPHYGRLGLRSNGSNGRTHHCQALKRGDLRIRFNFMTLHQALGVGIVHRYEKNACPGELSPMDHTFKVRFGLSSIDEIFIVERIVGPSEQDDKIWFESSESSVKSPVFSPGKPRLMTRGSADT